MGKKEKENVLIADDGTIIDNKRRQTVTFVFLCRVFTIALIALGIAALVSGLS